MNRSYGNTSSLFPVLRNRLLPLLMNGQVRVSAPLDVTPAGEKVGTPSPKASTTERLAVAAEGVGRYGKKGK